MDIQVVTTDEKIMATFALMKQLRPHLEEKTYLETIKHLQIECGYQLVALYDHGEVKAAAGYRISHSLAWGKHLYVDDLITDENSRSRGYAKHIFDWIEEELEKNQCAGLHLDSGVHRYDAHRFYLNRKMNITCHHFEKLY